MFRLNKWFQRKMMAIGKYSVAYVLIVLVALSCVSAQLSESSPVESTAHADLQQPIENENIKKTQGSVDLNAVDKELFKRLFIERRKEHLEAVKNLQKMDSYERQYKMINVLAEKMFDVIESKKDLLENLTETELKSVSFSEGVSDIKNNLKDAISSVLENIALFGDVVLNLPDITQRILKTQPKWNSTIRWSFDFLNRTKDLLDKSTLEMINLALQELNITKREAGYFNPNRKGNSKQFSQEKNKKKDSSKKEKRERGPSITKIEL